MIHRDSCSGDSIPASRSERATSARRSFQVISALITGNTDGKPDTSGQLLGALCGGEGVGDLVERLAAGEHLVERVQRDADAVVGHAVLLEVVRPDLLRPAAALHLITPRIRLLRVLSVSFDLQEP